jgi:hypothetical protein
VADSEISDDEMRAGLAQTREYTAVVLSAGENYGAEGRDEVVWEHGRRNFALRADGRLAVVCPVMDDTDLCGIGIFTTTPAETAALMDDDPGVKAGVFTYRVHPVRSFPGDALPG